MHVMSCLGLWQGCSSRGGIAGPGADKEVRRQVAGQCVHPMQCITSSSSFAPRPKPTWRPDSRRERGHRCQFMASWHRHPCRAHAA